MKNLPVKRFVRLGKTIERVVRWFQVFDSRVDLRKRRRMIASKKGGSVVSRRIKKEIKDYAKKRFGSTSYWPGVAWATELRGEYKPGWIPFDYFYFELEPKLNPIGYANIGDIRTMDYKRFGDFAIKPLFVCISNNFYDADYKMLGVPELLKSLAEYNNTIVVKQEFGWGGKQVRVMHSTEFKPEQLHRGANYIIQPFLKQYVALSELYPESVNTFRVITFRKKDGSVKILVNYLRFGVDGNKVDNITAGGQSLLFDSTGKAAKTAVDLYGQNAGEKHKNTGYVFADLKIPMFHHIVDKCRSSHQLCPYVRLIGWDIAVDESGAPRLIEWNTQRPDYTWADAVYGPLIPDNQEFE